MNGLLYCFLLSFSVMAVSACIDDKKEQGLPPVPDSSQMILKENLYSGGGGVCHTDACVFNNDKLATHTTVQEFHGQSLTHEVTLSYSGSEVTLTDENGNIGTYISGDTGYVTECTCKLSSQIRKYKFIYSGEYLTRVDEEIDDTPYPSVKLAYGNGSSSHIVANGQQTNYQVGNMKNPYQPPCLQVCDVYPPSLHTDVTYARLLGTRSKYLIIGNTPEGNEEEYTKYTYESDKDGKPTGIMIKTTSTSTVIDVNGNVYNEVKTDTRIISINIE